MEKTVIGLIAAIGAAAPLASAQAAVPFEDAHRALNVGSVADLLDSVPNAANILAALDAESQAKAASEATKGVAVAQWHHHHWHHHHWHHHHYFWHHHHHHHHWHHHHWHHHHWGW